MLVRRGRLEVAFTFHVYYFYSIDAFIWVDFGGGRDLTSFPENLLLELHLKLCDDGGDSFYKAIIIIESQH